MSVSNKKRWRIQAVTGLLLSGSGLSMAIDAGLSKMQGGSWFWYGAMALIVFQSGLCLVVDSVRFKNKV
ncbi:MAG: hypothetical protein H7320_13235 [Ferruginibacter sp.]|nr:hypothetical protein [Ferruginibacter sp.]